MPKSSIWSLSFWPSHQNPACIPLFSHMCYMPYPPHPTWLDILIIFGKEYRLWHHYARERERNIYFKHCMLLLYGFIYWKPTVKREHSLKQEDLTLVSIRETMQCFQQYRDFPILIHFRKVFMKQNVLLPLLGI
jgi:hypothetical protein